MPDTDLTQLNSSINTFLKIIKGKVNDKDFSYDDKGLEDAIEYATQLMRDKKHVKFSWHDDYKKLEKIVPLAAIGAAVASGLGAAARAALGGGDSGSSGPGVTESMLSENSMFSTRASKNNIKPKKKNIKTISKDIITTNQNKPIQKLDPSMAALAGWWLGGTIDEMNRQRSGLTPSQQREFDRQVEQALRRQHGSFRKDITLEKLQSLSKTKKLDAGSLTPPKAGLSWDPTSHRWVNPKTKLVGAIAARKGKKRVRGTGTGAGQKRVSGHGKGPVRFVGAGRKYKTKLDVAAKKKKFGIPKIKR